MQILCSLFFLFYLFTLSETIMLLHTPTYQNCRSTSTLDPIDNGYAIAYYDFECLIYQSEDEGEEDLEVPEELSRLF